jgi:hypothetical protein
LTSKFQFIQVIPKSSVFVKEDTNQGVDDQENREEKFEHGMGIVKFKFIFKK